MIGCSCSGAGKLRQRDGSYRCAFCGELARTAPRPGPSTIRTAPGRCFCVNKARRRLADGRWRCHHCGKIAPSPAVPAELGFMVTPGAIADRVAAIDAAVQALVRDVDGSSSPKLSPQWRAELHSFARRWQVARDTRASWTSRLFNYEAGPELDRFHASYAWWARDFERKAGKPPTVPAPAPVTDMAAALIPSEVWWVAGACALVWVLAQGPQVRALSKKLGG